MLPAVSLLQTSTFGRRIECGSRIRYAMSCGASKRGNSGASLPRRPARYLIASSRDPVSPGEPLIRVAAMRSGCQSAQ